MDKVKVMLIVPLLDQGGLERICALTAQLIKEDVTLTLVVFNEKGRIYDVSGVDIVDLKLGSVPSKLGKAVRLCQRVRALRKLKKSRQIQISYSFGGTANIANVLSTGKDKKWIGIRGYKALEQKINIRITCFLADKIVCCSEIIKESLEKSFGSEKTVTIYNPCDFNLITLLSQKNLPIEHNCFFRKENQYIASMGRADDRKGYWHLVKAFALVEKQIPNARLVCIGDGDFSEYRELAQKLKMQDKILFAGLQTNPFMYLKQCQIYALTSPTEGFPNALVEAMAVGLPVVSTNCQTGPAEILSNNYEEVSRLNKVYYGEYGTLIPNLSANKNLDETVIENEESILAAEIIKILEHEERKSLGEIAKMRAKEFSNEAYKNKLMGQIRQG